MKRPVEETWPPCLTEWHRQELRRILPKNDPEFVEQWISHVDLQAHLVSAIRDYAPMPSAHLKQMERHLGQIENGITGLLGIWTSRVKYQRHLDDTKSPAADDLIATNNAFMNRAFQLWRELVAFRHDLQDVMPETGASGRPAADSAGLVQELAQVYVDAGFGNHKTDQFIEVACIVLEAAGLPSKDPSRAIQAVKLR